MNVRDSHKSWLEGHKMPCNDRIPELSANHNLHTLSLVIWQGKGALRRAAAGFILALANALVSILETIV